VTVKAGKGGSRQHIARFAIESKERAGDNYDAVWCVMDVEHPTGLNAVRQALALLKGQEIRPALSNPAFEVWLLAHFEQTGTVFADCDAVIRQLDKHWQRAFRRAYDKVDSDIYQQLSHLTDTAIANAKWVRENHHLGRDVIDGNSSTDVDVLVGTLRGN
jgi:uncharacterized protein YukE